MSLVDGPARVSVPATSANLGPGFDSLGLALDLRDELEAEVVPDGGLVVEVDGEGSSTVSLDEGHLVVRAVRLVLDALGERPAGLRVHCHNVVPHARGLGSSSAAIVGGLVVGRALVVDGAARLDDTTLFRMAAEMEGHPDNVAPALFGGLTVSGRAAGSGELWSVRAPVDARIGAVVLVPPGGLSTEVARDLLPSEVSHADAAANAGAAALLMTALAGRPEWLHAGTEDRLHQAYRAPAMPESLALVERLRATGHAAVVSGAGPTVLVLGTGAGADDVLAACPEGWLPARLAVSSHGALVLD